MTTRLPDYLVDPSTWYLPPRWLRWMPQSALSILLPCFGDRFLVLRPADLYDKVDGETVTKFVRRLIYPTEDR